MGSAGRRRSGRSLAGLGAVLLASGLASCGSTPAHAKSGRVTTSTSAAPLLAVTEVRNPSLGEILADSRGMSLYHYSPESDGHVKCTGTCARTWTPLTVPAGRRPVGAAGIAGSVGTSARPGGVIQVTYEGYPLYLYEKDSTPGEASGEGLGGVWSVIGMPATWVTSPPLRPLGTTSTSGG